MSRNQCVAILIRRNTLIYNTFVSVTFGVGFPERPLARSNQRLETRDHVEKFFIDATLTQLVRRGMELLE
jgi:hypothetical protein